MLSDCPARTRPSQWAAHHLMLRAHCPSYAQTSTPWMASIPALFGHVLCAGKVLIMSDDAALAQHRAGDDKASAAGPSAGARREALLTSELALGCSLFMFTVQANGPQASVLDPFTNFPTREEIENAQKAVLASIGEKGSEKRAHANSLCAEPWLCRNHGCGSGV